MGKCEGCEFVELVERFLSEFTNIDKWPCVCVGVDKNTFDVLPVGDGLRDTIKRAAKVLGKYENKCDITNNIVEELEKKLDGKIEEDDWGYT